MNPFAPRLEDTMAQRSVEAFDTYWRALPPHLRKQYSEGEIPRWNNYVIYLNNQLVESLLPVQQRPLDWLECGCGRGDASLYMRRRGHRTVCLDASSIALGVARENFRSEDVDASWVQGDLGRLGLGTARFDVVFAMGVLEHLAAVDEAVREMVRILRPGGRLIVEVQIFDHLTVQAVVTTFVSRPLVFMKHLLRLHPVQAVQRAWGKRPRPYYVNGWMAAQYRRAFERLGLTNVRVLNAGIFPHLPIPASWEPAYVAVMRGVMRLRRAIGIQRPFVTRTGLGNVWVIMGDRPQWPT